MTTSHSNPTIGQNTIFLSAVVFEEDPEDKELIEVSAWSPLYDDWLTEQFCPEKPLTPKFSGKYHMTNRLLEGSPAVWEISDILQSFIPPGSYLALHDSEKTYDILKRSFPWFSFAVKMDHVIDTRRWAKHLYPDLPSYGLQFLRYALPDLNESKNLSECCQTERAKDQTVILRELFLRMGQQTALENNLPSISLPVLYSAIENPMPVKIIDFGKHRGIPVQQVWERDPKYFDWLTAQDWFPMEHPDLNYTIKCLQDGTAVDDIGTSFLL